MPFLPPNQQRQSTQGTESAQTWKAKHSAHFAWSPEWQHLTEKSHMAFMYAEQTTQVCDKLRLAECSSREKLIDRNFNRRFLKKRHTCDRQPACCVNSASLQSATDSHQHSAISTTHISHAFCFAGPYVWNSLPEHIRQSTSIAVFKHSLKTFLLQQISHPAH